MENSKIIGRMLKINQYKIIQTCAKDLIKISKIKNLKYPFREDYLDRILKKYEKIKGLYKLYLKDLPLEYKVEFNGEGYKMLSDILNKIKQNYGLDSLNRKYNVNFYLLKDFINKKQRGLTIKTILNFRRFLNNKTNIEMDIPRLEKTITSIGSKKNKLKTNGLPINLNNKKWAIIFGSILDSWPKKFNIVIENKHFGKILSENLENLGINPTYIEERGNTKIVGHSILGTILGLSGININQRQLIANNILPLWIFNKCDKKYHAMLLSKILDTEGHSNKNKPQVRIVQSSLIEINQKEREFIFENSKSRIMPSGAKTNVLLYSKLSKELKEKVLENPSLMLICVQLLLRRYKINSVIYPVNVYISSNNLCSICWHLSIHTLQDIKRFYEEFGGYISIPYKRKNILDSIKKHMSCLHIPKNLRIAYYLLHASKIEEEKGYFKTNEVAKLSKKKNKTVCTAFGVLISNNYVSKIGKQGKFNKLRISQKGKELLEIYPYYKEFKNLFS